MIGTDQIEFCLCPFPLARHARPRAQDDTFRAIFKAAWPWPTGKTPTGQLNLISNVILIINGQNQNQVKTNKK